MPATRHRYPAAFTLLEVLIVLAVIGVLAGMMIPDTAPNVHSQLYAVASILGRDIEYARHLAVANADQYKITFDLTANQWVLSHSGTNVALDALPINPLHRSIDPPNQQITALNQLPSIAGTAQLFAVWALTNPPIPVADLEFLALGETTRAQATVVWLSAGSGANARYLAVRVNPITGLYWVEGFRSTTPTASSYTGS